MAYTSFVVFVETRAFTARIRELIPDESYRRLQAALVAAPDLGVVIPGTGGIRKIRWLGSSRGKRGGIRILYFSHPASRTILLLFAFAKAERDDLGTAQKAALRRIVATEYP
jgi:hypothetical protein